MKFGHVDQEAINDLTFTLPDDHQNSMDANDSGDIKVLVGCGKWGIPAWVGPLYPKGTRQKDFLNAYIERFGSIELNGTFYRLSRSSIEKWSEAAQGTSFQFCPKWSQRVSHFKRLSEVEENTQYFMDSVNALGDNLGATFLTLPPNFGPKHMQRVHDFLDLVPTEFPLHIELRHKDWFEAETFDEVTAALKEKGHGLVITDVALRRDALHMCRTTREVFVRFNGYGLHPTDFQRLDDWIDRLSQWKTKGVEKVYFFMHQQDESNTIRLCQYFIEAANDKLQAGIKPLEIAD